MKLIDFLIRLYPGEFRSRYGREMREFHDERVRNHASLPRVVGDHVQSALAEHIHAARPDVKYALRGMLRRPGFAAVIILTIALGVGANAAIFSVVNGILLRPLPYRDVDRVLVMAHQPPHWLVSEPQYAIYRDKVRAFASLAAYTTLEGNLDTPDAAERVKISGVTTNFFSTLGVEPLLGRTFAAGEDGARPFDVMIMSYDLWEQRFGGDPSVVGRQVRLNGAPRTVIGVMPQRFSFPSKETKVWLPTCSLRNCTSLTTIQPDTLDGFANHYLNLVARLRDGFTRDQAFSEANALARQIMRDHPGQFSAASPLVPDIHQLRDKLVGSTRPFLIALLGAVGVVLLIVCANVASLLLSRGEVRRREMSLRMALGAPRRRLVTQLLTEAVTLSMIGGIAGLALAWAGSRGLVALAPPSLPRLDEIRVDWLVVVFGVMVSLAAGIVFGIAPAMRASREDPAEAIKSSGKGTSAWRRSTRARHSFVIAEVALSMVLLSGAGMLVRSLIHMQNQDMGFNTASALTAKISLNNNSNYSDGRVIQFNTDMLTRLRAIRGVQSVGAARWLPVTDQGGAWDILVEGKSFPPGQTPTPTPQEVTPGWFAAMGIPIKQGRDFTDADRVGSPLVGIVSERLAKKIWGDEGALNRRFRLGGKNSDSLWVTVIGVVGDIRARNFTDQPEPTMYFAYAQAASSSYYVSRTMSFVMRAEPGVDPMSFVSQVRSAARSVDPSAPVSNVMTLDEVAGTAIANRRFSTMLIAGFAALALVLASIGIYGVISYAVSERKFELGVRMALGADRGNVLSLVVKEGVRLAAIGVAIGVLGAIALARIMSSMLVGASGVDVMTLTAMSVVLGLAGALASLLPARRATAASPTEALRSGS